ncbi:hypothetical protein HK100_007455, partial [Physocladia obscura]
MIVVPATVDHWSILSDLAKQTFTDTFGHLYSSVDLAAHQAEKYTQSALTDQLSSDLVFFLCSDDDTTAKAPVGFCHLKPNERNIELMPIDEFPDPCWELYRFYLTADSQGKGGGSFLMRFVIDLLRKQGVQSLWLSVWSENYTAQRFYEKFGI